MIARVLTIEEYKQADPTHSSFIPDIIKRLGGQHFKIIDRSKRCPTYPRFKECLTCGGLYVTLEGEAPHFNCFGYSAGYTLRFSPFETTSNRPKSLAKSRFVRDKVNV